MKIFITLTVITLSNICCFAQSIENINEVQPDKPFENILVKSISSDSLSSSFIIWVKNSVKAHTHKAHTEQVYVLTGEGTMQLGDSTIQVSSGSFIYIPKNTVHSVKVSSSTPMKVLSIQSPKFEGKDRHFVE